MYEKTDIVRIFTTGNGYIPGDCCYNNWNNDSICNFRSAMTSELI